MQNNYNWYPCTHCYSQTHGYYNWYPSPHGYQPVAMPYPQTSTPQLVSTPMNNNESMLLRDYGKNPFAINIASATKLNNTYRTALWTGKHLQLTLMSIEVGDDIGLEIHPHIDQFVRIEDGQGVIVMGDSKDQLTFRREVHGDDAFIIPAGKWHNLINTGNKPIKLYSIYAPVQHPYGTVQQTKDIAKAQEKH
ncbi:cupin domain-containing protein [Rummeliibacillus sp. TYF005]|uniref:cupin domain-containing protein n=1 Tax=unclassified Rummeliibacillus TaxID=2622809 RepID=UPI000E66C167|nr:MULTISPECIES: cupin domain-containing protein [unclassified Rummeliibacillus]RIJ68821.1 cupin domain-containing protein [Rummeliibacillus sp. POC4]RPJ94692.1 cupin domain-containing protein [Rummeliibacillus sp. TYF005]